MIAGSFRLADSRNACVKITAMTYMEQTGGNAMYGVVIAKKDLILVLEVAPENGSVVTDAPIRL